LQRKPTDPALNRAIGALRAGHADVAEPILQRILKSDPDNINANRFLADCAIARNEHDRAEALLERCLALAPKFDGARHRLVTLLYQQNRLKEALPHIDILLTHDPQNIRFRSIKASIVGQLGDGAQSLALLEGLVRDHPGDGASLMSYGHALKVAGRQDDSIAAYRRAVALLPQSGDGYSGLANLKSFRFSESDIANMNRRLTHDDLNVGARVQLHFALGKAHEDLKDYAQAFEHYREGNALWRATITYDPEQTHSFVDSCKATLSAEFFEQRRDFGHNARDPIFIVGLPRAGSTLVEQILASHSQIEGTMELPNIPAMARDLNERGDYPGVLADLDASEFKRLGAVYLAQTSTHRTLGRPFFIDKMPNNFAHVPLIHVMLPNAKIIDARRHPMGCCFSNYKQFFERGQHFTFSLSDLGRYYRDYVDLMAHWDAVLPGKVHRVIYEDLVSDPEMEIRRLLDYVGAPFEEQCLRFHETERAVRTASSEQVRQPLNKSGVNQWKHFEPWLAPLKDALGSALAETL